MATENVDQRRAAPRHDSVQDFPSIQSPMAESAIAFDNQDQIRMLFGSRDRHLKRVKNALKIDVVVRGDEVRLQGSEEEIERATELFSALREILNKHGQIRDSELDDLLNVNGSRFIPETAHAIRLGDHLRQIEPRTAGQAGYIQTIRHNDIVICSGPAGSGKTYLAVAMALNALRKELVRKIVLVRPAVEAGEKLGFLPGDMLAKVNPYIRPLLDALNDMLDFETVRNYMENDVIEIAPLAFMRGRTLNHTFMILDEGQNTTVTQMKMFLTRMGMGSKIVVTGDTTQNDLPSHVTCGLIDAMRRLAGIKGVGQVSLTGQDIVRNRLVRAIVKAYDDTSQD
jgi:phosphate starvation-inducible protein PhoH and related proteins